jgi:serine protease Do
MTHACNRESVRRAIHASLAAGLVWLVNSAALAAQETSGLEAATALENSLVKAIAGAEKSVVAIARVRKEQPGETARKEFRPNPFGNDIAPTDPSFVPNEYCAGVVVDRRGLVLTAAHALGDENDSYYITTSERRVYRASIKAADPRSDLAVLSVDSADAASLNLAPIPMGDAASLRKGQIIVTLGNPYAIARDGQASAGWGIVSNLGRKAPIVREDAESGAEPLLQRYGGLIQTDARLHLGASGGPLLNLKGEMVGLCLPTAAISGYESPAGYAIPVDEMFRRALDLLKQGREAEYGLLGIEPSNLTPEEVAAGRRGVRVRRVYANTPADRAGLRTDDIIASVGERAVHDSDGFVLEIGRYPAEAVARLEVVRGGARQTKEVVLSKFPVRGRKIATVRPEPWRGLRVDYASAYLEAEQPVRLGAPLTDNAVVVCDVEANSPAAASGLKRGMLVGQVDGRPVRTPREFRAAIAAKSGPVRLKLIAGSGAPEPGSALVIPPGS